MKTIRPRLAVSAVLVLCTAITPGPATGQTTPVEPYRAGDRSVVALNILPPGQGRYMNSAELLQSQGSGEPVHNRDQLPMYAALIQSVPTINQGTLDDLFKDASFGVKPGDIERQYEPRPGVVVLRDRSFGVPHIYGKTRSDTMFGAGYVTGEDRMFMIDVLRHVGRGRLTQLLGPSDANLAMDCAAWLAADYTEAELEAMINRLPPGADAALANQAKQDVVDFTAGVNKYITEAMADPSKLPAEYTALQISPSAWKITDTVAVAALIGSQFGVGGGNELRNAFFLDALESAGYTEAEARQIFDDFRFADDPEAPVTADGNFPWNIGLGPIDPASQARPDPGSFQDADDQQGDSCSGVGGFEASPRVPASVDGPLGPIQLFERRSASNALLVGPDLSKTGQPMAVFGPQVGYWSPEILMELDMHGPGIAARGVGFPGISQYVLLGRGDGYGWSATSAGGDIVDTRVVKLCDPVIGPTINSGHYIRARDGQCVPIVERTDTWLSKPTAGGTGLPQTIEMTTERVELGEGNGSGDLSGGKWGIVIGRGEVGGDPVLFVQQRSTYGAEVDSAVTYVEILNPDVINGPEDFHRAFGRFNYTFNWFYVDDHSIANQLVGAHPNRAQGADIDLPYWDGDPWK
ncbi:MAG: penicillin acylase family protein, partial [Actinomycetota bacterium]